MIISGRPPALVDITGTSAAIASNAAKPKLSYSLVNKNKSAMGNMSSICSCLPKNLMASHALLSLAAASIGGRSGPSPNSNNLEGIFSLISKKAFTTSSTLLTLRKLLACTIIFSPLGAINFLNASTGFLLKRFTSTKL